MSYADSTERAALISGLRSLADYLESNERVPAPKYKVTVHVFPPGGSDRERRTEIDVIASRMLTQAATTTGGHYVASRFFGPVEYRAVAIPSETAGNADGE